MRYDAGIRSRPEDLTTCIISRQGSGAGSGAGQQSTSNCWWQIIPEVYIYIFYFFYFDHADPRGPLPLPSPLHRGVGIILY